MRRRTLLQQPAARAPREQLADPERRRGVSAASPPRSRLTAQHRGLTTLTDPGVAPTRAEIDEAVELDRLRSPAAHDAAQPHFS
jgi:hypothetical protein